MYKPEDLLYTNNHEYIFNAGDYCVVGLTEYGLKQNGDTVFVELPESETYYTTGEVFATMESVRTGIEIHMPVSATIIEINTKLIESPELLNESPYDEGWLVKVKPEHFDLECGNLMDYSEYKEKVEDM